MIAGEVFGALAVAVVVEAFMLWWLDRRAALREAEFWEQLRIDAALDYGRLFDWEQECREFGCHE